MVERSSNLDRTFAALADPTRRAILARLRAGAQTVGALAEPFPISLAGVSKHVRVLEQAGLIEREARGRERHCHLRAAPLREAARWTVDYATFWEGGLDRLGALLEESAADGDRA